MPLATNKAALTSLLDKLERQIKKVREMLAPVQTTDVSPECQESYDIAIAASATAAAAYMSFNAAYDIEQAAWAEYWDCESP